MGVVLIKTKNGFDWVNFIPDDIIDRVNGYSKVSYIYRNIYNEYDGTYYSSYRRAWIKNKYVVYYSEPSASKKAKLEKEAEKDYEIV